MWSFFVQKILDTSNDSSALFNNFPKSLIAPEMDFLNGHIAYYSLTTL